MPGRRYSLYAAVSESYSAPFLTTTVEQQLPSATDKQTLRPFDGNQSSPHARRRPSLGSKPTADPPLSQTPESAAETDSIGSDRDSQGFDRHRKDAASRLYQTIYLLGDQTKLSPESASKCRCFHVVKTLGEYPIHPITKFAANSNGCVALLNDRNQVHIIGNASAIGMASPGAFPGTGYRDVAMLYSALLVLDPDGSVKLFSQASPKLCPLLSDVPIRQFASSDRHAALVSDSGELYTFGCAQGGALGLGRETPDEASPQLVRALQGHRVRSVSCGVMFTVAIIEEYHAGVDDTLMIVYSWGIGCDGRLGHGDLDSRWLPTNVNALSEPIAAISCGDSHCLALTSSGIVYSWGANFHGQLGYLGSNSTLPQAIALGEIRVAAISAGRCHSAILSTTGVAYMFGSNRRAQLGIEQQHVFADVMVPSASSALNAIEIEKMLCKADFTLVAGREKASNSRSNDEPLKTYSSDLESLHKAPHLDVVDYRYQRAGLDSRCDYYTYIVLDNLLSEFRK